jgi:short-subunit dehydrogenase
VFGILRMSQAFAPVLANNGGGAFLNILSVVSWASLAGFGAYSASKSAAWNLTNGLRGELRAQGTQVLGLHVGFVDTDLTRGIEAPKVSPALVAERAYAALERGESEVLIDDTSRQVKQGLTAEPSFYLVANGPEA